MAKLSVKNLISIHDLTERDVNQILVNSMTMKSLRKSRQPHEYLLGKTLAMIFEKPSTRTRVSFEVGMSDLGGKSIVLGKDELQLGVRESTKDVANTLSRYVNGIMIRTFSHKKVLELAEYATVPVINGLSDLLHPCQVLSDLFTITEKKGTLKDIKMAFIGDGNNVCHSLMLAAAKTGFSLSIATPKGYEPKEEIVKIAFEDAKESGAEIKISNDPVAAVSGADVIYTDVWTSMGKEKEAAKRKKDFKGFQVNSGLVKLADEEAIVMHCLPAHRGEEITDDIIDGKKSAVWDQAENRLHTQKAIMMMLMGGA